ncbi:hypothetical protein [Flavobacterium psychrophilum]
MTNQGKATKTIIIQ